MMIRIKGGTTQQKEITTQVVDWCLEHFKLYEATILVSLKPLYKLDWWGDCEEGRKKHSYNITIATSQSVRDFVATLVHEMIHVMQWETKEWVGDGEKECEKLQYTLTDQLWEEGAI